MHIITKENNFLDSSEDVAVSDNRLITMINPRLRIKPVCVHKIKLVDVLYSDFGKRSETAKFEIWKPLLGIWVQLMNLEYFKFYFLRRK